MNKKRITILVPLLCIGLIGIYVATTMFNKTSEGVLDISPDVSLESSMLLNDFLNNEDEANTKYLEKVVEVTGKIAQLDSIKNKGIVVLRTDSAIGTVICHLEPSETSKWSVLKKDQNITIKGICTGYLMDVILVKCMLTK
ncbi:hypothetical protein AWE51_11525 [Aquimarina aggregata]|uniref:tRNA_anti-like n=1 Tax=Aquimarina aggregata TaxID=1642818 RepID=A0A162YJR9_9FLAO|nr:hypothetical protein [Aquimarina aggregata]KZS39179.1 hypothetical protein AWE51_11525 [Aquimarina aggregata]